MQSQLDVLVCALYVTIDDHFAHLGRLRPTGRPPRLSDSELACLAVAQVLLGFNSERHWLRFVRCRLAHLFPYIPQQPAYNKRLRAAGPLLAEAIQHLAILTPSWCDRLRLMDSTPLPCGTSRETVKRSALAGLAKYGYCAAHSRYFWGMRLHLITTPDGIPVIWCLADPKIGDREVAQALLEGTPLPPGTIIVADKGYAGREFEDFVREQAAALLRPDRRNEPQRLGSLGGIRQRVESVIWTLKGQLGLERHGGRTDQGVFARVAQRLLALTAAIWHRNASLTLLFPDALVPISTVNGPRGSSARSKFLKRASPMRVSMAPGV